MDKVCLHLLFLAGISVWTLANGDDYVSVTVSANPSTVSRQERDMEFQCNYTGIKPPDQLGSLLWFFKRRRLFSYQYASNNEFIHPKYKSRIKRINLSNTTMVLILSNTTLCDSGEYTCKVSDAREVPRQTKGKVIVTKQDTAMELEIYHGFIGKDSCLSCNDERREVTVNFEETTSLRCVAFDPPAPAPEPTWVTQYDGKQIVYLFYDEYSCVNVIVNEIEIKIHRDMTEGIYLNCLAAFHEGSKKKKRIKITGHDVGITECARNPCFHGGVCKAGVSGYTCACRQGFEGNNCETAVDGSDSLRVNVNPSTVSTNKQKIVFTCEYSGFTPPNEFLTWHFMKGDVHIYTNSGNQEMIHPKYRDRLTHQQHSLTTQIFLLTKANLCDAGNYTCQVSANTSHLAKGSITVTKQFIPLKLEILRVDDGKDYCVSCKSDKRVIRLMEGETCNIRCTAFHTPSPEPELKWFTLPKYEGKISYSKYANEDRCIYGKSIELEIQIGKTMTPEVLVICDADGMESEFIRIKGRNNVDDPVTSAGCGDLCIGMIILVIGEVAIAGVIIFVVIKYKQKRKEPSHSNITMTANGKEQNYDGKPPDSYHDNNDSNGREKNSSGQTHDSPQGSADQLANLL